MEKIERKLSITFILPYIWEACKTVPLNADWVKMYFALEFCICLQSSSEEKSKNII